MCGVHCFCAFLGDSSQVFMSLNLCVTLVTMFATCLFQDNYCLFVLPGTLYVHFYLGLCCWFSSGRQFVVQHEELVGCFSSIDFHVVLGCLFPLKIQGFIHSLLQGCVLCGVVFLWRSIWPHHWHTFLSWCFCLLWFLGDHSYKCWREWDLLLISMAILLLYLEEVSTYLIWAHLWSWNLVNQDSIFNEFFLYMESNALLKSTKIVNTLSWRLIGALIFWVSVCWSILAKDFLYLYKQVLSF